MGIVVQHKYGFTNKKHYVIGNGFVEDSVLPVVKNMGAYPSANKDLMIKPVLGAVGSLGSLGLTNLAHKIAKRMKKKHDEGEVVIDENGKALLQRILKSPQEGSGLKSF